MNGLKWDKEFAMEQAADDQDLLQELLTIFKDALEADVLQIEQGLKEEAAARICSAAHSIKGASASLGILGIEEIALAIEQDGRAGELEAVRQKLPQLQSLLQQVQNL